MGSEFESLSLTISFKRALKSFQGITHPAILSLHEFTRKATMHVGVIQFSAISLATLLSLAIEIVPCIPSKLIGFSTLISSSFATSLSDFIACFKTSVWLETFGGSSYLISERDCIFTSSIKFSGSHFNWSSVTWMPISYFFLSRVVFKSLSIPFKISFFWCLLSFIFLITSSSYSFILSAKIGLPIILLNSSSFNQSISIPSAYSFPQSISLSAVMTSDEIIPFN